MEVTVKHSLLSILVLIAIVSAFLIPFLIRSGKRGATIARLKKLEKEIADAESKNVEALALREARLELLKGGVSEPELADLVGTLALAGGEHRRSSGSFAGCRESVNRLIDKGALTETLDSFVKDYERIRGDMETTEKILQAFDKKWLAIRQLMDKADQRLAELTLEIDRTEAGFKAAESRGFKLGALRAIFSSVNHSHISTRDGLLAEHRMGNVVAGCENTSSLLKEINTALDRLHESVDDVCGNFAAQRKRHETLIESLAYRRQDLPLIRIAAREQYLAVIGLDAQAESSLEEAGDLIIKGVLVLAELDMDEANRFLQQTKECLDQAETKLVAIEAAKPKPAAVSQPSP